MKVKSECEVAQSCLTLCDALKTATPAASTGQKKGPNSSPQQCLTTRHTTDTSKAERIRLQSFDSSAIFT